MKRVLAQLLLCVSLLICPDSVRAQQSHVRELADIMSRLRSSWQDMPGLSARFTHTFEWILAGETQVTRGHIYLVGRRRFRIEFDGRTMVSDGTTLWDYDSQQNQVVLYGVDSSHDITTQEQIFAAYTENVSVEWVREEQEGTRRLVVIRLLRGEDADPRTVDIWVDTGRMLAVRAAYTDGAGNNHLYVLEDVEVGELPDERFRFVIPEGVVVVDLRPGGGA